MESVATDTFFEQLMWQRERLRDLSLDDVHAMAREAHARLMAAIASLEDGQLAEQLTIGQLGTVGLIRKPRAGEQAWALWQWLDGVTYLHYSDHAKSLEACRAQVNQRPGTSDQKPT